MQRYPTSGQQRSLGAAAFTTATWAFRGVADADQELVADPGVCPRLSVDRTWLSSPRAEAGALRYRGADRGVSQPFSLIFPEGLRSQPEFLIPSHCTREPQVHCIVPGPRTEL